MHPAIEAVKHHFGPEKGYKYAIDAKLRSDQQRLASLVGTIAISLPIIVGLLGFWAGDLRSSISMYYYEVYLAGDVFVGFLVFIGALMTVYRGWAGSVAWLATIAGLLSCMVAFFPARGWVSEEPRWELINGLAPAIHGLSALVLFLILAFFCLFIFTEINDSQHRDANEQLQGSKKVRNRIYKLSGWAILLAIAAIFVSYSIDRTWAESVNLVYWSEFVSLVAFGISWLTHGRVFYKLDLVMDDKDKQVVHELAEARAAKE